MKIRSGFVSNSSSASFMVKVDKSVDDFLDELYNEFQWTHFKTEHFKYELEQDIKRNEEYIEKFKKDFEGNKKDNFLIKGAIEGCEIQNQGLRHLIKCLPKMSQRELTSAILNHHHVDIAARKNGKCELWSHTIMYNSAGDAPEFLHMIVFYLALTYPDKKYEVSVERE